MRTSYLLPIACVSFLPALFVSCTEKKQEIRKPNIIYILADDLGRAELGCFGQEKIETPNIDFLASEGMRFTNHYSGQAVSAPSRCVLFTGLHTGHAYIRGNDEVESRGDVWSHEAMLRDSSLEGQCPVPANTVMIPRKLKEAGYATACIGKWGLGFPGSDSTPNKMGFDFFMVTIVSVKPILIILHFYIGMNVVNILKISYWCLEQNLMKMQIPMIKKVMQNLFKNNMHQI